MGIIRSVAAAIASAFSAFWRTAGEVLKGLKNDISSLLGRGSETMPPGYVPETSPMDVLDEFRDRQARELATAHARVSDIGRAVYQYASAPDPDVRCAVDISGLSPVQADWLLGLKDSDLDRLANAGPRACGEAARGRKCGLVGLPMPEDRPASVQRAVAPEEQRGDFAFRPAFA